MLILFFNMTFIIANGSKKKKCVTNRVTGIEYAAFSTLVAGSGI